MTDTLEPMMPKIRSPLFIPKNLPKFINSTSFLNENIIELILFVRGYMNKGYSQNAQLREKIIIFF